MRECFIAKDFASEAQEMIDHIEGILSDYQSQGYDLSLRQLYYQFVARDIFPNDRTWTEVNGKWIRDINGTKNAEPNYKWLGGIVSDARLAGLIDWDMIKDRGREMVKNPHWSNPGEIVRSAASQFRIDRWADQPNYVEVMVEKQALEGVLVPVCSELDVPFTANKGYSSSSSMYEASKRFIERHEEGKSLFVLYLGDHDPSGIDMTRDVLDRMDLFVKTSTDRAHEVGSNEVDAVEVKRLALNMDQVRKMNPPENPAKITDSRARSYIRRFGTKSWELDAIEPAALASLVRNAVNELIDKKLWAKSGRVQEGMRKELLTFADSNYPRD